jgi:menaquinone-dependent protoporphyrinogen oxidase
MKKALVAYATKTGTTAEVAVEIGKALEAAGWSVDIKKLAEVSGLGGYSAAVIGAPINGMSWLPEAKAFVAANAAALGAMPVACFYLSYIAFAGGRETWKRTIKKGMDGIAASIDARSLGAFGGRLPGPLPGFARFLFGTERGAPLDKRDWDAIRSWASALAGLLGA